MKLSGDRKALVAILVAYLVADFFLTPLGGLEVRPVADVTVVGDISLGMIFGGAILAIVSLVLLLLGRGPAPTMATIAAVLFLPGFLADQTGNFSKLHSPTAIFWLEWVQVLIAAGMIVLSMRARREGTPDPQPGRRRSP